MPKSEGLGCNKPIRIVENGKWNPEPSFFYGTWVLRAKTGQRPWVTTSANLNLAIQADVSLMACLRLPTA